jgi:hypothetical protein
LLEAVIDAADQNSAQPEKKKTKHEQKHLDSRSGEENQNGTQVSGKLEISMEKERDHTQIRRTDRAAAGPTSLR